MANTELLEKPWLDILPPPLPESNALWLWLAISIISVLILGILLYLWQRRPRYSALRELKRIQNQLEHYAADHKHALYEVNRLLCLGLGQSQLPAYTPANEHSKAWQQFYQRLAAQQYNKTTPLVDDTRQLLQEAQHWLRTLKP